MNVIHIWIHGPRIFEQLIHKTTFSMTSYIIQVSNILSLHSSLWILYDATKAWESTKEWKTKLWRVYAEEK